MVVKLEPIAEQIANVAYFLLVVGIGIEFYQLIKEKKRQRRRNYSKANHREPRENIGEKELARQVQSFRIGVPSKGYCFQRVKVPTW